MTHFAIILFFSMIFIGVGLAAQMMVREYWAEIFAALHGQQPLGRIVPLSPFKVVLRPSRGLAAVRPRRAAA